MQVLSRVAKRTLCIPATSAPSERVFSSGGNLYTDKRCSLRTDTASDILFCKHNTKLIEDYYKSNDKN